MNNMNMNGEYGAFGGEPLQGFNNGGANGSNGNFIGNGSNIRVLRTWELPPNGITQWEGTNEEMRTLFDTLPQELSAHLIQMFPPDILVNLNEIYLQLGQIPECVVTNDENDGKTERGKLGRCLITMIINCRYAFHIIVRSLNLFVFVEFISFWFRKYWTLVDPDTSSKS